MSTQWQRTAFQIDLSRPEDAYRKMDSLSAVQQMGQRYLLAISGGRVAGGEDGIYLPVRHGYWVSIHLHANDTYIVRRVLYRKGQGRVKQEWRDVYAEELGQIAFKASCYNN